MFDGPISSRRGVHIIDVRDRNNNRSIRGVAESYGGALQSYGPVLAGIPRPNVCRRAEAQLGTSPRRFV